MLYNLNLWLCSRLCSVFNISFLNIYVSGSLGKYLIKYTIFVMIENFPPISRVPLPIFRTNCQHGSHFAKIRSHFEQNTTTNPSPLLSCHTPRSGICTYTNTQSQPQNTPFPGLNLKVGKMNYSQGKLDTNWAKCLKSAQKKLFIYLFCHIWCYIVVSVFNIARLRSLSS